MKERIEIETDFASIVVFAKDDEQKEFLARHAIHQLLKHYKREYGSVEHVLSELEGYFGTKNKPQLKSAEPSMSLADIEERYQAIMRDEPGGYEQNKALSDLLDVVKREFNVPLLRNVEWEREHPAIIAMYRKIANSRT